MVFPIKLSNEQQVIRLNREACKQNFDLAVHSKTQIADARSLLALFTFINKDAYLVAPDDIDPKLFRRVIKRMGLA